MPLLVVLTECSCHFARLELVGLLVISQYAGAAMAHRRSRGSLAIASLATLLTIIQRWMAGAFAPVLVATRCPAKHPSCRQFRRVSLTGVAKHSDELRGEGLQSPSDGKARGAGEMLLLVRGGWQGELYNLELSSAIEAAGVRSAGGNLSLLGAGVWRLLGS